MAGQLTDDGKVIIPLTSLSLSLTKDSKIRDLSLQEKKALCYVPLTGFEEVKVEGDNLELEFGASPPHIIHVRLSEDNASNPWTLNCSEPVSPMSLFDTTVQLQIEVTSGNN